MSREANFKPTLSGPPSSLAVAAAYLIEKEELVPSLSLAG